MFERRTDLALEAHEINAMRGEDDGIILREYERGGYKITEATVESGRGEENAGKPSGRYITIALGRVWQTDKSRFEQAAKTIADEISALLPEGEGCVLAAGLGNEEITPDSIGPRAVKSLIVTRHLQKMAPELYKGAGFGSVAAIAPGVLGQTGVESADIIKGLCGEIKPRCVILIDSLASRRLSRLATTLQLSDNGISPGSGVFNRRAELSKETLGAPVVSIGVPTVVDAATLAYDLLEENLGGDDAGLEKAVEKLISGNGKSMFVTPKDADVIARETARLIACAINIAVHGITMAEINEYI